MNISENYKRWLNSSKVSAKYKEILKNMSKEEIDDAFYKDVEFGTAGMRGVLGPGTNRLNEFTIRKAAVGFSIYLLEKYPDAASRGVVISHDNRNMSRDFTLLSAKVLNDFGIKTYIFDSLRPTPELSFAVKYKNAVGGIMITASHNPKEYNGFKVYDDKGCQLVPSDIKTLIDIIKDLPNELEVEYPIEKVRGETITLKKEVDDAYVKGVEAISLNPKLDKSDFKIVYTPNNGTSYVNLKRIFKDLKYKAIPVLDQCDPDPDFTNVISPNPEEAESFKEAIEIASENDADLIFALDPDGDRVGVGYRMEKGKYELLNGNEGACLLLNYICTQMKRRHKLDNHAIVYSTIVSTPLGKEICDFYGVTYKEFLTGFKYIGHAIGEEEVKKEHSFLFGFEESYGCLASPIARDKDGLQATLLYTEMALFYKQKGLTLGDAYKKLASQFGYHKDVVKSFYFKGSDGDKKMKDILNSLRESPLVEIDGAKVICIEDYLYGTRYKEKETTSFDMERSDVIKYYFDDKSVVCIRPSGTEPKIKFYVGVVSTSKEKATKKVDDFFNALLSKLNLT